VGPFGIASVAAVTEELLKLLVVAAVALLAPREFDDPMDGIVYGSMAGLGAALEESVFYTRSSSGLRDFVPAAELVRLWAHVILGGMVGFPLGFWRSHRRHVLVAAPGGLFVAACLHFAWDAIVLSAGASVAPGPGATLMGIALMVVSLALYGRLVLTASARSRQQFAPKSSLQLWGWPFHRSP
jgi:RsiW-degrading membrane proteinase PrsW (M82 family)